MAPLIFSFRLCAGEGKVASLSEASTCNLFRPLLVGQLNWSLYSFQFEICRRRTFSVLSRLTHPPALTPISFTCSPRIVHPRSLGNRFFSSSGFSFNFTFISFEWQAHQILLLSSFSAAPSTTHYLELESRPWCNGGPSAGAIRNQRKVIEKVQVQDSPDRVSSSYVLKYTQA